MIKAVESFSRIGMAVGVLTALVGAFVSIHAFLTALIGISAATGLHGIASHRKK